MLKIYTLDDREKWDEVVKSFSNHDIYWLSGYVKAFKIHGDGEPILIYIENGSARGINVVMKRDIADIEGLSKDIPSNKYFDLSTPYGYGGWIIDGEKEASFLSEYEIWASKNNIISEFVRFHPMVRNHEFCENDYEVVGLGEVVHMDLSSPEVIWSNISSKNRNHINKAIKSGVKIYNGRFPEIFHTFKIIYDGTMERDTATDYYFFEPKFYESILTDLPQNAQVFWAEKDDQIIAASIILAQNGRLNYHLSGSRKETNIYAPTNLLLYEVALWGSANGYKTLYLGGGVGSGEDSLFKFKRAFYKGDLNRFYIGKKIFDVDKYNELVEKKTKSSPECVQSTFFPKYRA